MSLPHIFYTRPTSNNACRVHLWLALSLFDDPSLSTKIECRNVTHSEQLDLTDNITSKIPLLMLPEDAPPGPRCVSESQIILDYLHTTFTPSKFTPPTPSHHALMAQIVRTHDLYIASPNSLSPPRNLHTQSCLYIPPPAPGATRGVPIELRAALLQDLFKALRIINDLIAPEGDAPGGGYSLGEYYDGVTLADVTIYPTLINCVYYLEKVFGFDVVTGSESDGGEGVAEGVGWLWKDLPRLHRVYLACERTLSDKGGAAFREAQMCERLDAVVAKVREDVRVNGGGMKWHNRC